MRCSLISFTVVFGLIASFTPAQAAWNAGGNPVSVASGSQFQPTIIPDGAGGVIIAWYDSRSGTGNYAIYVQRVDGLGVAQWTADGVAVCNVSSNQVSPAMISDGAGGAIITWGDARSGTSDIYAQWIDGSGVAHWTAAGVAVCSAAGDQTNPQIVSDGAGGAIVTWEDGRGDWDIYAQRVDGSGVAQWTAGGVALCTALGTQSEPAIVPDGVGGAIVTFADYTSLYQDIFAQRVNAAGVLQWAAGPDGVALCTAADDQSGPRIVSDGAGGAVVTWDDHRTGVYNIYAQRVDASGVTQWTADGVALCTGAAGDQVIRSGGGPSKIISDGGGGAIVAFESNRSGTWDIYAQMVSGAGMPMWLSSGKAVCTVAGDQYITGIVTDGAGGAIITWEDNGYPYEEIYAQRMSPAAVPQWTLNGVVLSGGDCVQPAIASAGTGAAIVTWEDRSSNQDIYAQRVEVSHGYWGHPEPHMVSLADKVEDQGGRVVLHWQASDRDLPAAPLIKHYTIWRQVAAAPAGAKIVHSLANVNADTPGPIYYATALDDFELVGTQNAQGLPTYSFDAPTLADSVAGNSNDEVFMIGAVLWADTTIVFQSNTMSGHSVDNLAPGAPTLLTAQRVGADVHLEWDRSTAPDLRDYSVYRSSASGVTPVPANFLASADDTFLVDVGAPGSALYYIVTATDVHDNQSEPSNEANVRVATGVEDTPAITALTVLPNSPNPFTGTTTLSIGLPAASDIEVDVYDVAGQRVRVEKLTRQSAGWRSVDFDGHDDAGQLLASGVYFYRVHAAGTTVTRKMILVR